MSDTRRFGIEEEFFVVDAETKAVMRRMPQSFFDAAKARLGDRVRSEMLQSQVEITSSVHSSAASARNELKAMRGLLGQVAADHGLAILASGTHPTAMWATQRASDAPRYDSVMHDLQMLGQRNIVCGLHVHAEFDDPEQRVDIMTRLTPYIPLIVALSTSSPFWQARATGLMGYRLAAYDELPRTGLPELFSSQREYDDYIALLVEARIIEDSSYIWWAVRPSRRFPTLELRAPDCCTHLDDSLAIAALYRCLVRYLLRHPQVNAELTAVPAPSRRRTSGGPSATAFTAASSTRRAAPPFRSVTSCASWSRRCRRMPRRSTAPTIWPPASPSSSAAPVPTASWPPGRQLSALPRRPTMRCGR